VGAEHVFELVRHLTERDREAALCLYEQQLLTTEQLRVLFFCSRRRAQDRLLFLYRARVLDRFYPASRFGTGKPQAHWLLDEAGAILVAASLGIERKQLSWSRRDDWRSHPQLAHRLELNRFVTDLVAATLPDPALGIGAWYGPRRAAARLGEHVRSLVRPDAELLLLTPGGTVDLLLEWDRGTETQARLAGKLRRYGIAERKLRHHDPEPRSVLFIVPGERRLRSLAATCAELGADGFWPIHATTVAAVRRAGPLAPVWQRLDADEPPCSLPALPARTDLDGGDPSLALGRRWRHDHPAFWERLSPLGRIPAGAEAEISAAAAAAVEAAEPASGEVPYPARPTSAAASHTRLADAEAFAASLARRRAELLEEARRDAAAGRVADRAADLRSSGVDGSMPDPRAAGESWR
jgi:hypothetical protein